MQRSGKRGKYRTPYSSAPAGYSRARAQRRGAYKARQRRQFRVGYDRTGGFYGRYSGGNAEMKFHDLDIDDAVVAANGNIAEDSCLTIAEGNGESNRIGRKITVKKINWRYDVRLSSTTTATSTSDTVRVVLYLDKQCNGATAVVATDAGIFANDNYQSFKNLANSGRFKILMDRTHAIQCQSAGGNTATNTWGEAVISQQFYKTCNIPIEYDNSATDGTISTMRSNNIGVLLFSETGVAKFASSMRIRYSDR